jgi:2-deoxy-D-gluconate 3-dehydrogenase
MKKNGIGMFDLTGKRALVTGGYGGLGRGIAEALCDAGAKTLIVDYNHGVEQTALEIGAIATHADLSDLDVLPALFDICIERLGGLDILVNNAGILTRSSFEDLGLEEWRRVLNLNLDVVFRLCQLAGTVMVPQKSGKIINMASMLSYTGGYIVSSYAASKGAVVQLTKAISNEWAGRGVNVNAIAPGYMNTPINTSLIGDSVRGKEVLARIPIGRWGLPEDLAGTAVFLSSPASDYITGAVIPVDGGYLSR